MIAEDYREQFLALLPQGRVWTREPDSQLSKLLLGLADEFARVDARIDDLLEEQDARTTNELLVDWERVTGLPGDCVPLADTLQERRAEVVQKLTTRGGQDRQFFIDVAARLGFRITITEVTPFRVDINKIGDPILGEDWWFAWQVNGPLQTIRNFQIGQSQIGEPLRDWGNDVLECVINELAPAHTIVLFAYT